MCMFPVAGYLMDNRGRRVVAVACLGILSLGLSLVPLTAGFVTLTLAAMTSGLGNGLGSGINMTLGADFAPARERAEFLGVWRLMGDCGSFAGPILMGYVANTFVLASAFLVTAVLGVVGAVIVIVFVHETLHRDHP